MVSLSDLTDGPKMFRETFGPKWGPRWWRVVFTIVVIAIACAAAEEIGGTGSKALASIRGLFFHTAQPAPSQSPAGAQKCVITGGENKGVQVQTCN